VTYRTLAISALTLGLAPLAGAGCYVSTQPMPVETAPAPGEVVVTDPPPPPPPLVESPPPPPQPGMTWVAGYHRWDGHNYVWERGHYDRPPRADARYVAGHWEGRGRGKVWVNGHWT
jgi:WXXGXW repeat (2 copies)